MVADTLAPVKASSTDPHLPPLATYHSSAFSVAALLEAKQERSVTVCLPARDEQATVGDIVHVILTRLQHEVRLVDEVLVVDDGSRDGTAERARAAGARVVDGGGRGKGHAMWVGVSESTGDVVVFCDADVRNFRPHFVLGLLGPLLTEPHIRFVKGFYERPLDGRAGEGGRVTELVAKPLLRLVHPPLAQLAQPLSGECAADRELLERLPFVDGWGVDIALVLDAAAHAGTGALAQVDLGERVHRNRPLGELVPQAETILRTVLSRAGLHPPVREHPPLGDAPGHAPVLRLTGQLTVTPPSPAASP